MTMDIQEFTKKKAYLYHLTDKDNLANILETKEILSTESIVNLTNWDNQQKNKFLSHRRKDHEIINTPTGNYKIRDQKPISLTNLVKCLTKGITTGEFFKLLNMRVFFWPTLKRLESHYNRYASESPIIHKVESSDLFNINSNPEFCRLNSGATRSNSHLKGAPPERGINTFLSAEKYNLRISQVAEVTFPTRCILPSKFYIGKTPSGPWKEINL
jgi:hypothetical protein